MRRLCAESSRSYPGRSASQAARVSMEVELRARSKGLELPPDPTVTRAARWAATSSVMRQKSAEAIVAPPPRRGVVAKGRT
jgi:hypothetical protein